MNSFSDNHTLVDRIGASAGGLEASEQIFKNMPVSSGIAFVVIQHLDPTHAGILPELLQRVTPLKVLQATNSITIKGDHILSGMGSDGSLGLKAIKEKINKGY